MITATAPQGINSQDWVNTTAKGEYRGHAIYKTERAKVRGISSNDLVTWWAVKDGRVVTCNGTRKNLLRTLDLRLDMTDEQREMRDRVMASLRVTA